MSRLHFAILESQDQIANKIVTVMTAEVQKALIGIKARIEQSTREILENSIKSQPEYGAIIFSSLRYELGLVDAQDRMNVIIDKFLSGIQVNLRQTNFSKNFFVGGFVIKSSSSYASILRLPEASFTTEKGEKLDWLEWLLLEGNNVIIADYRFKALGGKGRTGGGLMLKGGTWRVPPESAGTANDNFITRAIAQIEEPLTQVVQKWLASI
jgi:hypothetical protein